MNEDRELDRLLQLAKTAQSSDAAESQAPFGFATRITAQAWGSPNENALTWILGLRWGIAGAAVVMFICVGMNFSVLRAPNISADAIFHQQLSELILP
jgi:hypothetical protein